MGFVGRGRIEGGRLVLAGPLPLPEGAEVIVHVHIEPAMVAGSGAVEGFTTLPFFGMWADREDVADGAEWVRRERERWPQRASRRD